MSKDALSDAALFVALTTFLVVALGIGVFLSKQPRYYSGIARVVVESTGPKPADQDFVAAHLQWMRSSLVLDKVIEELGLNTRWAPRPGRRVLSSEEASRLLSKRLEIRSVPNSRLFDIKVFSEDKQEAAAVANKLAEVYRAHVAAELKDARVQIIDVAVPGVRPVRPNLVLNAVAGFGLAFLAAWLAYFVVSLLIRTFAREKLDADSCSNAPPAC
jgi:capsular polysaccharide biosynthesis protein